jgi:holo-[acyl-carrier protein] synthase
MKIVGVGSEVVECLRVARMIERHGEQFIHRVFTPNEVKRCNHSLHATQQFAARWAAKEAVLRALGVRSRAGFDFRNIEIRRNKAGRFIAAFRGAARDIVEQLNVGELFISIAHCRSVATAQAVAVSRPRKRRKPKSDDV